MIVVYPSFHVRHKPPYEIFNGQADSHAEIPDRIEHIKTSLENQQGVRFVLPRRFPRSWIERVHDISYVNYLAESGRLAGDQYMYPSVFSYAVSQKTQHEIGLRGQYSFDMYTPVSRTTYQAAHGSAMAALTGASLVRRGEKIVYALCRPPGHHAEKSKMGGYCYFNNAAVAAEYLSTRGKVAVVDIDVHHGNGTQSIFYSRADVLTVSIHGNPDSLYPYFTGRSEEQGEGKGLGYNINYPLPLGTSDRSYDSAFRASLERVKAFRPTYLIVAIGYDAHIRDPIGKFHLSTSYYSKMARSLLECDIPTLLVQEGGYNTQTLGDVACAFVSGFKGD